MSSMRIESDDIRTKRADDRGRLYLGTEYANKRVTVAIVEAHSDHPDEERLAAAYRDAAGSARELASEWQPIAEESWDALGPSPAVDGADDE